MEAAATVFYVGVGFTIATETAVRDDRKPPTTLRFILTVLLWPLVALYRLVRAIWRRVRGR